MRSIPWSMDVSAQQCVGVSSIGLPAKIQQFRWPSHGDIIMDLHSNWFSSVFFSSKVPSQNFTHPVGSWRRFDLHYNYFLKFFLQYLVFVLTRKLFQGSLFQNQSTILVLISMSIQNVRHICQALNPNFNIKPPSAAGFVAFIFIELYILGPPKYTYHG